MIAKIVRETYHLFREAIGEWMEDKASQLGAAMAFYSILSLAPLLVISIALVAFFMGDQQTAKEQVSEQMHSLIGPEGADAMGAVIENAQEPGVGTVAALLGLATLLFGASGVFGQLQDAMNTIWDVPPKKHSGILDFLRNRFLSFAMVLGTGFLLLVSMVLSAVITGTADYLSEQMGGLVWLVQIASHVVSFVVVTLLFAMIFRFLPDADVHWRDVWIGAAFTSLLFSVGKYLMGLYLGTSSVGSAYGAAGSVVVLIVWIYYSAQILFFGAELTQVWSRRYGSKHLAESEGHPASIKGDLAA